MKLIAGMLVRNEEWVLGLSARVALMWCDALVIHDHASTDRTEQIMWELKDEYGDERVILARHDDTEWREMSLRQDMLASARARSATHFAIVDADEVVTGNLLSLEDEYGGCRAAPITAWKDEFRKDSILQLPGYNLRKGICQYHANGIWANRWFSTVFRDDPRLHWGGDHYHHREPKGLDLKPYRPVAQGQGGVMHLWGASDRRLRAKSALYKMTDPDFINKRKSVQEIDTMYSWAIKGSEKQYGVGTPATWTYAPVPDAWWAPYAHLMKYLDVDAEPWQEKECQRLYALNGADAYRGLDLFGVV